MRKSREEQGITLIALIITIIVLLILALVTLNAIQGDGDLIAHANNAGTKYTSEGEKENTVVADYINYLNNNFLQSNSNSKIYIGSVDYDDETYIFYGEGNEIYIDGTKVAITGKIPNDVDINNIDFSTYNVCFNFEDEIVYYYIENRIDICSQRNCYYSTTKDIQEFTKTNVTIKATMFGQNVGAIGKDAFNGCVTLTSIKIPSTVTYIGERAFKNCTGLTEIELPDDVNEIDHDAFCGCTNLSSIKYNGTTYTSANFSDFITTFTNNGGILGSNPFDDTAISS